MITNLSEEELLSKLQRGGVVGFVLLVLGGIFAAFALGKCIAGQT